MPRYGEGSGTAASRMLSRMYGGAADGTMSVVERLAEQNRLIRAGEGGNLWPVSEQQAQVGVATSQQQAQAALDRLKASGINSGAEFEWLSQVAHTGQPAGGNWFTRALSWLDRPGQLVRYAIADITQEDEGLRSEITGTDYMDILRGRTASLQERHPASLIGEDARMSGSQLLGLGGYEQTEGGRWGGGFLRGLASTLVEVGTDPLSLVTTGGGGASKKVLLETAGSVSRSIGEEALELVARDLSREGVDRAVIRVADDIIREIPRVEAEVLEKVGLSVGGIEGLTGGVDDLTRLVGSGLDELPGLSGTFFRDEVLQAAKGRAVARFADEVGPFAVARDWANPALKDFVDYHGTPAYMKGGLRISPVPVLFQNQSKALSIPYTRGLGRKVSNLFGKTAVAGQPASGLKALLGKALDPWQKALTHVWEGMAVESWITQGVKKGLLSTSDALGLDNFARRALINEGAGPAIDALRVHYQNLANLLKQEGLNEGEVWKVLGSGVPLKMLESMDSKLAGEVSQEADDLLRKIAADTGSEAVRKGLENPRVRQGIVAFMYHFVKTTDEMFQKAVRRGLLPADARVEQYIAMVEVDNAIRVLDELSEMVVDLPTDTAAGQLAAELLAGHGRRRLAGGVVGEARHAQERTFGVGVNLLGSKSGTSVTDYAGLLEHLASADPAVAEALARRIGAEVAAAAGRPSYRLITVLNEELSPIIEAAARKAGVALPRLREGETFRLFQENPLMIATQYLKDMSDALVERAVVQHMVETKLLTVIGGQFHKQATAFRIAEMMEGKGGQELVDDLTKHVIALQKNVQVKRTRNGRMVKITVGGQTKEIPAEGVRESERGVIQRALAVLDHPDTVKHVRGDRVAKLKVRLVKGGVPEEVADLLSESGTFQDAWTLWKRLARQADEALAAETQVLVDAAERVGASEQETLAILTDMLEHTDEVRGQMVASRAEVDRLFRPAVYRSTTKVPVTGAALDEALAAAARLRGTLDDAADLADLDAFEGWAAAHRAGAEVAEHWQNSAGLARGLRRALGLPDSARVEWGTTSAAVAGEVAEVQVPFAWVVGKPSGVSRSQLEKQLRKAGLTAGEARAALLAGGDLPRALADLSEEARWTLLNLPDTTLARLDGLTRQADLLASRERSHLYRTGAAIDSAVQPRHFTEVGADRFEQAISAARRMAEGTNLPADAAEGAEALRGMEEIRRQLASVGAPPPKTIGDSLPQPARAQLVEDGTRMFLTADGRSGFAVTRDGEMFGLFNYGVPGADLSAVARAQQEGALLGAADRAGAARILREHNQTTALIDSLRGAAERGDWKKVGTLLGDRKNAALLRGRLPVEHDLLKGDLAARQVLNDPNVYESVKDIVRSNRELVTALSRTERANQTLHRISKQIADRLGDPATIADDAMREQLQAVQRLAGHLALLQSTLAGGLPFPNSPQMEIIRNMEKQVVEDARLGGWTKFADQYGKIDERRLIPRQGEVLVRSFALSGEVLEMTSANPYVGMFLENLVSHMQMMNTPAGLRFLAHQARSAEQWWKAMATVVRPTFHIRNLIGATFNNMIAGVRVADYIYVRDKIARLRSLTADTKTPRTLLQGIAMFKSAEDRAFLTSLYDQGILRSSFAQAALPSGMQRALRPPRQGVGRLLHGKANLLSSEGLAAQVGGWGMQTIEDYMRAACFHRWYGEMGPEVAREWVFAVHFDYTSLTRFESQVKRFVPFFVWTRRNLPLQLRALVERPDLIQKYQHLMHGFNDQYSADSPYDLPMPGMYTGALSIGTGMIFNEDTPFWARAIISPDLPLNDLGNIENPLSPASWLNFVTSTLGPAVQLPWTVMEQTEEGGSVNAPAGLNEILVDLHALGIYRGDVSNGVAVIPRAARTTLEALVPPLAEYLRPLDTDPARRQALGLAPDSTAADVARAYALQLAKGVGVRTVTPTQTYNESFGVQEDIQALVRRLVQQGIIPQE